jgi:cell division protein FtsB
LPTSVLSAIKHYIKGGAILLHKLALAQKQIYKLKAAAKATTHYKLRRRKRI